MSSKQGRIDLRIDVLDLPDQHALVLPKLKPPELVSAIIAEFRGDVNAEYLGADPRGYFLVDAESGAALDAEAEVGKQVSSGGRLALREVETDLPQGGQPLSRSVYLREVASGNVYRLRWQPAIVGRHSADQPMNDLVAVDLQSYATGLRVSRRQVAITEKDGQFFVENLSRNPVSIRRGDDVAIPIESRRQRILPGDLIDLERSDIMLKFIVRNGAPTEPAGKLAAAPAESVASGTVESEEES